MKTILCILILIPLASLADDRADKKLALEKIGISDWAWEKSGFGVIMMADITITNTSDWSIKDIEVETSNYGSSGTVIDHNSRTIYETVPAHFSHKISGFNMGFISGQTASVSMHISDFEFCQPHLSGAELKAVNAAAASFAATNAALAKAATAQKKKATADAVLKFNQEAAASGDAYGLFRMGERYRDGDGVETNAVLAREYFSKAAAAGSVTASNALVRLPR